MRYLRGKKTAFKKVWRSLGSEQRLSLSVLLFLLISLPVSLLLSLSPVRLFSRAYPATPPITPQVTITPTPTPMATNSSVKAMLFNDRNNNLVRDNDEKLLAGFNAIIWVCKLDQNNYACDSKYYTKKGYTNGNSYAYVWNVIPGYNDVWIHTLGGQYPDVWYTPSSNPNRTYLIPENELVEVYLPLSQIPYPPYPTRRPPTITPTPTVRPTSTGTPTPTETYIPTPTFTVTPTPTPAGAIPSFTTRYLKPGMSGRKYKTFIKGEDKDGDILNITVRGLPPGVSLKECEVKSSVKLSRITCEISGVPGFSGIYKPVFDLRDATGAGVTGGYTLFILPKFLP